VELLEVNMGNTLMDPTVSDHPLSSRSNPMGQTSTLGRLLHIRPSKQHPLRDHPVGRSGPGAGISPQGSRSILQYIPGVDSKGRLAVCQ
jgi:hypothetical protein